MDTPSTPSNSFAACLPYSSVNTTILNPATAARAIASRSETVNPLVPVPIASALGTRTNFPPCNTVNDSFCLIGISAPPLRPQSSPDVNCTLHLIHQLRIALRAALDSKHFRDRISATPQYGFQPQQQVSALSNDDNMRQKYIDRHRRRHGDRPALQRVWRGVQKFVYRTFNIREGRAPTM